MEQIKKIFSLGSKETSSVIHDVHIRYDSGRKDIQFHPAFWEVSCYLWISVESATIYARGSTLEEAVEKCIFRVERWIRGERVKEEIV